MDKLSKHAIRMLEIVDGENDFFRNDSERQADIARAVYDVILQVQMLKMADRKIESSDYGKPNNCETCKNWDIVNDHCYFIQECHYEPKTEPQMRDATAEERQGVRNYIKSIEKDTGIKFYEDEPHHSGEATEMAEPQTDCAWSEAERK